jgi:hypothetical protein
MGPRDEDWAEVAFWVFNSPSPDQLVKWFAGKPKDAEFPWTTYLWPTQEELAAVGLGQTCADQGAGILWPARSRSCD